MQQEAIEVGTSDRVENHQYSSTFANVCIAQEAMDKFTIEKVRSHLPCARTFLLTIFSGDRALHKANCKA